MFDLASSFLGGGGGMGDSSSLDFASNTSFRNGDFSTGGVTLGKKNSSIDSDDILKAGAGVALFVGSIWLGKKIIKR